MAYAHVGHDCVVGDGVTLCNGSQLGGHVEIRPSAMIGARAALHQFVRVGTGAMVAAGAMVSGNVPPWTLVAGDRARIVGPNSHALREHGHDNSVAILRRALRLLWPASGHPGVDPDKIVIALRDYGAEEDPVIFDLVRFLLEPSRRSCCSRGRN
jgi:UDP-N-acetylglucosamine acyltransferase